MGISAKQVKLLLNNIAQTFIAHQDELCRYDSIIGDGDHGFSMMRGNRAARNKIIELETNDIGEYFKLYGRALTAEIGGAIGPLFGSIFTEIAKVTKGLEYMDLNEFYIGLNNAMAKIIDLGGAEVGDKTMLDSIYPTVEALGSSQKQGLELKAAFTNAEAAAIKGVESTINLKSKRGRSMYLEEKSIGHQDAGATSFYLLIKTIKEFIEKEC